MHTALTLACIDRVVDYSHTIARITQLADCRVSASS
jgi:hypothetical protein